MSARPDQPYCTRCGKDGHSLAYCDRCPTCDGNGAHAEKLNDGDSAPRNVRAVGYHFAVHCRDCHGTGIYKWQPPTGICAAPCCWEKNGKRAVSPRERWHDQPLPERLSSFVPTKPQTVRVTKPAAPQTVRVATPPEPQTLGVVFDTTLTTDPKGHDMGLVNHEQ